MVRDAGITRYIAQTEQFGVGAGEGPVYSTISADSEEICTFPRPFSQLGMEVWYPGEDIPCATAASSPTTSSGCRSTATLTPSPRTTEDIPRLRDFDSSLLPRRPPHGVSTPPQAPSPSVTPDASEGHPPRALCPPGTGKTRGVISKSRLKPKCSRYRREKRMGELPPPPLPPPGETPGPCPELEPSGAERRVAHRPPRGDEVTPYSKPSCLPRGQVSGSCSTAGSVSSRGSSGSRGHGSGRSRTPGDRGEGTGHCRRPGAPLPCPPQEKR
ncbi:roundabout homolog 3-like [Lonchura striata]